MNWILATLLMFVSSVILYLFVRKSNELKTPQQLNNLAMFLVPVIVYIGLAFRTPVSFQLTTFQYIVIFIQGVFFSYLGNVFSLKGIESSPNPGYSLIISKSYVVFTAVASIFVFNAPLSLQSVIAIFLILIFSMLIMYDKKKNKEVSSQMWIVYTMGAFFCWGLLALSSKYLLNAGVPILVRLIYSMIIVTVLIVGEILYKKVAWKKVSKDQLMTLLWIGIFGASFNYFMQVAFNVAPNVGYVNAANAGSITLLTIMSAIFFKDELSLKKVVGIVGATIGLILLFL